MPSFFRSSVDPNKIALTIKGFAALVPVVVVALSYFHVSVGAAELNHVIDVAAQVVILVGSAVSGLVMLYGLIRKLFVS